MVNQKNIELYESEVIALKEGINTGNFPPTLSNKFCEVLISCTFDGDKTNIDYSSLIMEHAVVITDKRIYTNVGSDGKITFAVMQEIVNSMGDDEIGLDCHTHPYDFIVNINKNNNGVSITNKDFIKRTINNEPNNLPQGSISNSNKRVINIEWEVNDVSDKLFYNLNKFSFKQEINQSDKSYRYYICPQPVPSSGDYSGISFNSPKIIKTHSALITSNFFVIWSQSTRKTVVVYNLLNGELMGDGIGYTANDADNSTNSFSDVFKDGIIAMDLNKISYVVRVGSNKYKYYNMYYEEIFLPTGYIPQNISNDLASATRIYKIEKLNGSVKMGIYDSILEGTA